MDEAVADHLLLALDSFTPSSTSPRVVEAEYSPGGGSNAVAPTNAQLRASQVPRYCAWKADTLQPGPFQEI